MYLAHLNHDTGRCQTLKDHCLAVADMCKEFGGKADLESTAELIGLLHDSGKAKEEFLKYLESNDKSLKGKVNHSTCGARYAYEHWQEGSSLKNITSQIISLVICSHHGGLIDSLNTKGEDTFTERLYPQREIFYKESLKNFLNECATSDRLDSLFKSSSTEISKILWKINELYQGNEEYTAKMRLFSLGLFVRYLLSCLIDADRFDTFLFETEHSRSYVYKAEKPWDMLSERLEVYLNGLSQESEINKLRAQISLSCKNFSSNPKGIYQLFVPTGGGKTFSSLRYALNFAKKWNAEHIFYIIPFKTIIEQNAKDVREVLRCDDMILEHHSDIVIDNDDEERKLLTERWNAPIVFTTMVQFLNTLFAGKTQSVRRLHNLSNSVIIFDEIQSLPVKCVSMFNNAVQFLSTFCNSTIVLCTATQPQLSSSDLHVPLKLSNPENMIADYKEKFSEFKRTRIVDAMRKAGYTSEELAEFILEKLKDCSSVLTVLNTKKAVSKLFDILKSVNESLNDTEKIYLYHLSTSMCPEHRLKIIEEVKKALTSGLRTVCVSTQLIEAGVNLSFQCVIRSLAGLDNIAQAAGRCNRHGEASCRDVYVINSNAEDLRKLPDIFMAQESTKRVLTDLRKERRKMGGDLLSPSWIERYYTYYFHDRREEMGYRVKKNISEISSNTDLYDLLSKNSPGLSAYMSRNRVTRPKHSINQAFDTASSLFHVIDQDTLGVVVPYGDGERIIADLCRSHDIRDTKELLRQAQRFSVNLFPNEERTLREQDALILLSEVGTTILKNGYYNNERGLVLSKETSEALIV